MLGSPSAKIKFFRAPSLARRPVKAVALSLSTIRLKTGENEPRHMSGDEARRGNNKKRKPKTQFRKYGIVKRSNTHTKKNARNCELKPRSKQKKAWNETGALVNVPSFSCPGNACSVLNVAGFTCLQQIVSQSSFGSAN